MPWIKEKLPKKPSLPSLTKCFIWSEEWDEWIMFQNMQSEFSLWLQIWIENSPDPCNLIERRILHWQQLKNSSISDALWKIGPVDLTYIVWFENIANVLVIRTMWCRRYKWFFLTYYPNTMQQNLCLSIPNCFYGS